MSGSGRFGGFQPRNLKPERRAFFDLLRRVAAVEEGLEGVSGGSASPTPRILLTLLGPLSIPTGASTLVTWGTSENYLSEVGGTFKSPTANAITIPTGLGGDYRVSFSASFVINSTGVRQIQIAIGSNTGEPNEHTYVRDSTPTLPALTPDLTATADVRLDDGATLTCYAYQNSGGALGLVYMRFSAVRLGD